MLQALRNLKARLTAPPVPRLRQWPQQGVEVPWFDRPDAMAILEARRTAQGLTDEQYEQLRRWVQEGYFIMKDAVPIEQIDGMMAFMDRLWETDEPVPGLDILDLRVADDDPPVVPHHELVKMDPARKLELKQKAHWRIHGLHWHCPDARAIFDNEKLKQTCSMIFDLPAEPTFTINFTYGSKQALHQDTAVFHIHPINYLIGTWLACEDIHPESGPLVVYPGSHHDPMFPAFDNYPQTNLRTCSKENIKAYEAYLVELAKNYQPELFIPKKGEVLLWHGMLIHGGSEIIDPTRTRKSSVCHYIPPGMNKADEVVGPFNW